MTAMPEHLVRALALTQDLEIQRLNAALLEISKTSSLEEAQAIATRAIGPQYGPVGEEYRPPSSDIEGMW